MSAALAAALAAAAVAALAAVPPAPALRLADLGASRRPAGAARRVRLPLLLLLVPLAVTVLGPVPALLGAGALVLAVRWRDVLHHRRARAVERAAAVEACSALAGELRAGRTPAEALAAAATAGAGPLRRALEAASAAARLGGDVAACLRDPPPGPPTAVPEVARALAACWTVCAGSGSGLAAAVQRLEEGLRAGQAQRQAVDAELAGPRATASLLAVLPLAGMLMAAGLGADPWHVLLHTPVGLVCLVLGLGLDGLGVLWTHRLVLRAGGN